MPQWKWHDKYMIGGKVQKQVKLLEKMGWIYYRVETFSQPPYKRECYAISIVKLYQMRSNCKNFQSEKMIEYRKNAPPKKFIGYMEEMGMLRNKIRSSKSS